MKVDKEIIEKLRDIISEHIQPPKDVEFIEEIIKIENILLTVTSTVTIPIGVEE